MGSTRHILYINEFFHPDICASAMVLVDQLPRIIGLRPDWRITVIAGNRSWSDPEETYPEEDRFGGVRILRVARPAVDRARLVHRARGFWTFGRGVLRAAARVAPVDIVIGTTAPPHGGWLARRVARRLGARMVYRVLDLYPDLVATLRRLSARGLPYRAWRSMDAGVMRDADAVVAVCERMRERIAATRDVSADRLYTLFDGFDAGRLAVHGENRFRAAWNPAGRFVVQYAGNMGRSHPFETIVDATARLARRDDILFQFIGGGPGRETLARRLGSANAQIIDYQPADRLGEVLATADACLVSQDAAMYDQSIPYKVYASLAAGRPVVFVGSARSEIAAWLAEAGAGFQVDQGKPDVLAEVLERLSADRERAREMGRAARRLFERRFQTGAAAQRWVEIIEGLTERGQSSTTASPLTYQRKD